MNLQTKEILAEMGGDILEIARNLELLYGYRIDAAYGTLMSWSSGEFYYSIEGSYFNDMRVSFIGPDDFKQALNQALEYEGVTPTMLRMKAELRGYEK